MFVKKLKSKITPVLNHPGFRRYFANIGWLFAGRIFQMGIAFLVGVWVARYLGPAKFGLLSFSKSFVGLFMAISTLGLDGIVVRELVKDESKRHVLLGTSFVLKLVGAVIALILTSVAIYLTSADNLTRLMVMLIAASLIFQSFNVVDLYFQSKVVSKFSVLAQIISTTLSALVKIYLIVSKAPVIYFAAMAIFDMATIGTGYIYFYKRYTNETLRKWKFSAECAKSLLRDSWPLIFSSIAIGIYTKIDQVMIKYMLDNKAVGEYAAAVRLCGIWYIIPVVVTSSVFPAIVRAKKQSEKLYYERLQKLYDLMVWLAIGIALPITFLSSWIVNFLYGAQYSCAASVLKVYVWAGVFVSLGVTKGYFMLTENIQYMKAIYSAIGAVSNVFLNFLLIPILGVKGAAIATLSSQISAAYLIPFFHPIDRKSSIMFNRAILLTFTKRGDNKK